MTDPELGPQRPWFWQQEPQTQPKEPAPAHPPAAFRWAEETALSYPHEIIEAGAGGRPSQPPLFGLRAQPPLSPQPLQPFVGALPHVPPPQPKRRKGLLVGVLASSSPWSPDRPRGCCGPPAPQNREPFEAALAALHRCTALEPDGAVASAVVVAALERVDRADRGRWVDPLDDLHRPYAARRMAELALLEDIRAGSLSRVDDGTTGPSGTTLPSAKPSRPGPVRRTARPPARARPWRHGARPPAGPCGRCRPAGRDANDRARSGGGSRPRPWSDRRAVRLVGPVGPAVVEGDRGVVAVARAQGVVLGDVHAAGDVVVGGRA